MNKNILISIFLLINLNGSMANAEKTLAGKLEDKYFSALDGWVNRGGKVNEFQDIVVQACGKLVMATANASEVVAFTATQKEEFDFRVNVCAKLTVNRSHHQSEFDDPKIIHAICDDSKVLLFGKLCKRSGLR
ncbi:MAG: hypothetical protein RL042_588 [Nitrospirota bacterium]|jgi:hypothetical protein